MLAVAPPRGNFWHAVTDALRTICPIYRVEVVAGGLVRLGPNTQGGNHGRCSVGCRLLHELVASGATSRIVESRRCRYDADGGIVEWNPLQAARGLTELGREEGPPALNLVHELIHAHRDVFGTSDVGLYEEYETVRIENQIRRDLKLPLRIEYGGVAVPGYADGGTNGLGWAILPARRLSSAERASLRS